MKALVSQCRNMSSEDAPAGGFARVVGKEWRGDVVVLKIDKPNQNLADEYVVIGRSPIPAGRWGDCIRRGTVRFRWDTDGSAPLFGQAFGPKADSWLGAKGYPSGLTCNGQSSPGGLAWGQLDALTSVVGKPAETMTPNTMKSVNLEIWGSSGFEASDPVIGFGAINIGSSNIETTERVQFTKAYNIWIPMRGGEGGTSLRWFRARLNGALAPASANATVDSWVAYDGGSTPAATTAGNTFNLAGDDNDFCIILESNIGGSLTYILAQVQHHSTC